MMAGEKRRFSRVNYTVRAKLVVDGEVYPVDRLVDLSVGGCRLEIPVNIPAGTTCTLNLLLPRMAPGVEIFAKVVRSARDECSLQFTAIDPENLFHLQNIIRYNAEDPDLIEEEIKNRPGLM